MKHMKHIKLYEQFIGDIKTPIYFKSKKGISGLDKDTAFFVKDIPTYGNIKVHYYKGLLEMFVFFTKDEFMKQFNSEDFYKIEYSDIAGINL
jgi:hypothetical protein